MTLRHWGERLSVLKAFLKSRNLKGIIIYKRDFFIVGKSEKGEIMTESKMFKRGLCQDLCPLS